MSEAQKKEERNWLRRKLWAPVQAQLRQGLSAEGLAWSLSLALGCATCPVIGATTGLCIVAGAAFKLNHPVMQVVNYVSYPIQIALLVPFWRLGEWIFRAPRLDLDLGRILGALKADTWGALRFYWAEVWHGTAAWALVALPLACLLALVLTPILRRALPGSRIAGSP